MTTEFRNREEEVVARRFFGGRERGTVVEVTVSQEEFESRNAFQNETGVWVSRDDVVRNATVVFFGAAEWNRTAREFEHWVETHSDWEQVEAVSQAASDAREFARNNRTFTVV